MRKPDFYGRIKKLKKLMKDSGVDSVIISDRSDIYYYTGVMMPQDERGFLVIDKGKPRLFLSPLLNMFTGLKWVDVVFFNSLKDVRESVPEGVLGFDERYMTVYLTKKLRKPGVRWKPFSEKIREPRMVKNAWEIRQIKKSIRITQDVLGALDILGKRESDVAREINIAFLERGVDIAFETIVASGKNSALVHYTPGKRRIRKGDMVIVDCGVKYSGYCSDITRTFCMNPGTRERKIHEDVMEIQERIIDEIREGIGFDAIEKVYENEMKKRGYKVLHSFGHGIGIDVHERPSCGDTLKEGIVVTVEPGIYIKGWGGCRIEDMLLIGKKTRMLSNLDRGL